MHIADLVESVVARDLPVRFEAYDSSSTGPEDSPVTVRVRSPRALRYLARAPGELGLSRAYVTGELEIEGDMFTALDLLGRMEVPTLGWRDVLAALAVLGPRLVGPAPVPPEEISTHGRLHSRRRDADAISHHYDVSNEFYRIVLGPTMAYTCAVYPNASADLETAQSEKFDLVCRKLDLRPGMRLLDVGCGWGGMVLHATRHYGVTALGVTLSGQQAEWARDAIAAAGLGDRAEVRHLDYRDVSPADGPFDAISSIGLTEHIGADQLPAYFDHLRSLLQPEGRLLNHAIMRPSTRRSSLAKRGFMNRYVFPDAELLTVGEIAQVMADHGFEIRHEENLREHYARTLSHWGDNLMADWDSAVALAGAGRARVWRLYMAASRWLFATNRMQLHQLLGVKTTDGRSGFPWRPDWESRRDGVEEPARTR
ncbi:MAG: class I SAM-dependent methyltransferase [Acidimicrobiia bacterium]